MSNVTREDRDQLNAVLSVSAPKSEYLPLFEKKLKEFKNKAALRGFRKGHVPTGFVRKMYGKAIFVETIESLISTSLHDYLKAENPHIIGEPIPCEDQELLDLDFDQPKDYTFRFDIGMVPEIDIKGLDKSLTLQKPNIVLTEAQLSEKIEGFRKRFGNRIDVSDQPVTDGDMVELHIEEWEGGQKKAGGIHTHVHFLIEDKLTDTFKGLITGRNIGDTFHFDPFETEKDASEAHIRKHILHLEDETVEVGKDFLARVDKISRMEPADLNQAFFDRLMGPGVVSDEASLKEKLVEYVQAEYNKDILEINIIKIRQHLLDQNPIPLPEDFVIRWLKRSTMEEREGKEWTQEEINSFLHQFRWSLILDFLKKQHDVQATRDEIIATHKHNLRAYFGANVDEKLLDSFTPRLFEDKEMVGNIQNTIIKQKLNTLAEQTCSVEVVNMDEKQVNEWLENAYKDARSWLETA